MIKKGESIRSTFGTTPQELRNLIVQRNVEALENFGGLKGNLFFFAIYSDAFQHLRKNW